MRSGELVLPPGVPYDAVAREAAFFCVLLPPIRRAPPIALLKASSCGAPLGRELVAQPEHRWGGRGTAEGCG